MRTAVLTCSTGVATGEREDVGGPALAQAASAAGCEVVCVDVVADGLESVADRLRAYVDEGLDVVLTTGGTGLTPDDLTPEATAAVITREVPGIQEALRAESLKHTTSAMISRGLAGVAGTTLIVNLPGSPKAIAQLFDLLASVLPHAVRHIHGDHRHRA